MWRAAEAVRMDGTPQRGRARAGMVIAMTHGPEHDRRTARQARTVAVVIAATMLLWMAAQWLGGEMGWEARYVFLFDMLAMAGFLWALIVTFQIWRRRRND